MSTIARPLRAFTLIEAIIYLALFTILMGGGAIAAYNLFEAATHGGTRVMLQEETDFMMAKIEWALYGAQSVTSPAAGTTGSSLTIVKWNPPAGNPVVLSHTGNVLSLSQGGGAPVPLNNTNTEVTKVTFNHVAASGDGIDPESVETVLTLTARTSNGFVINRTATSTVYLRK
jgi:hypothetical protein